MRRSARTLERGTFAFSARITAESVSVELDAHELSMLLEGIDADRARASARWEPPAHVRVA